MYVAAIDPEAVHKLRNLDIDCGTRIRNNHDAFFILLVGFLHTHYHIPYPNARSVRNDFDFKIRVGMLLSLIHI